MQRLPLAVRPQYTADSAQQWHCTHPDCLLHPPNELTLRQGTHEVDIRVSIVFFALKLPHWLLLQDADEAAAAALPEKVADQALGSQSVLLLEASSATRYVT
jgi:hypothetical protein